MTAHGHSDPIVVGPVVVLSGDWLRAARRDRKRGSR